MLNKKDDNEHFFKALEKENIDIEGDNSLIVSLDGFEGPLNVLLLMARSQKVDLHKISILKLTDQYLTFIEEAKKLHLNLAADYLVMAAWLTYLKSRLLLPVNERQEDKEEENPQKLAENLTLQLQKLQAFKDVADKLMQLPQKGEHFFEARTKNTFQENKTIEWNDTLHDLLYHYGKQRMEQARRNYTIKKRQIYAIDDALKRLKTICGVHTYWFKLEQFFPTIADNQDAVVFKSAKASTIVAALSLVKEGVLILEQKESFKDIFLRSTLSRNL